jgi:peptidoglycan hydrolase-like protein with peptidoglycan-binding domain
MADPQAAKLTNAANQPLGEEQIRRIQERLKHAGFDPGPIDGVLGPKTKAAISRCKSGCTALEEFSRNSAKPVFELTPALQLSPASVNEKPAQPVAYHASSTRPPVKSEASKTAATLDSVSSEQEIREAQERLKAAGLDPGPIDGVFGPKTKAALEKYRSSY